MWSLSRDAVMTCVGKTNGSGTVPIQPREEKRNIRLAINYVARSSRFGFKGKQKVSFGEICLLALS